MLVCENVPHVKSAEDIDLNFDTQKLNIIYAGTLEAQNRGLEWIPSLARDLGDKVHFYVAGTGTLSEYFMEQASKIPNITFLGPVSHSKAMALQKSGDLIYGIYRTHLMNNVLAAPNKFYESTFLGTPFVTNKGLLITNVIEHNDIGFSVNESYEAMAHFLDTVKKEEIDRISEKAKDYWKRNYTDYIHNTYEKAYRTHLDFLTNQ